MVSYYINTLGADEHDCNTNLVIISSRSRLMSLYEDTTSLYIKATLSPLAFPESKLLLPRERYFL